MIRNFLSYSFLLFISTTFFSCKEDEQVEVNQNFTISQVLLDKSLYTSNSVSSTNPVVELTFTDKVDTETVSENIKLSSGTGLISIEFSFSNGDSTIIIEPATTLEYFKTYNLRIGAGLQSQYGIDYGTGYVVKINTKIDPSDKFERITENELLELVQRQTFRYFWDFAHPESGMARERNTSGDIVTTGGSGFGLMAIIVGIERGFISRKEGVERLKKIITYLESADRFHGVWPHWLNGKTGKVQPFSNYDNGGDLVETSFLIQGLLTFREYLYTNDPVEKELISRITTLWEEVEWDWYTKDGEDVLYWHWSPDKGWTMNHQIKGYNEALITYVLAAASPTHSIEPSVYHSGWASNGGMVNGKEFYDITLPLGYDFGGPLFFTHYSFLGLDPRNLQDQYANYWDQNVNHTLINYNYSIDNPRNYIGYSKNSWGLTASDNHNGYSAHSPTNDLGVITPTAALSSFPYTPEKSMQALDYFYYTIGDKLWGPYGFYDAYNLTERWIANSYLAIDQGPIIIMIENYRTGLLWDLFMDNPEIAIGLDKLNFTSY